MAELDRELRERSWEIQRGIIRDIHRGIEIELFALGTLEKVNRALGNPTMPTTYERHYYIGSRIDESDHVKPIGVQYYIAAINENRVNPASTKIVGEVLVTRVIGDHEFLNTEAGMLAEDSRIVRARVDAICERRLLGNLPDLGPDLRTIPWPDSQNL